MGKKSGFNDEGKKTCFYYAEDNSSVDELKSRLVQKNITLNDSINSTNLGLRRVDNNLFTSNYVGVCRLKDMYGKNVIIDGKEIVLKVEPRFSLSIVKVLNYIKDDDEFERYLSPQTIRYNSNDKDIESLTKNELFHFFENEPPIEVSEGIAKENSIITVMVFLTMLRDLCKRPLMGKMIKKQKNLVGKVKGKILFNNNIKMNTIRGRNERFFCEYQCYSQDILENQILKAALQKAKRFVSEYFNKIDGKNYLYESIAFCNKSLSSVSNIKIKSNCCDKVKLRGCYAYYNSVIKCAKMVLDEISIESSGKLSVSNYIIPYAISMDKLFEFYVRTYLKKNGILSYINNSDSGIILEKYDYKVKVFDNKLVTDKSAKYIAGNIKPDIVLRDISSGKYVIFDVKYKKYNNNRNSRNDRLQLLAYSMMFDSSNIGIIFPTLKDNQNFIFESQPINTCNKHMVVYHQILLNINDNNDDKIYKYILSMLTL